MRVRESPLNCLGAFWWGFFVQTILRVITMSGLNIIAAIRNDEQLEIMLKSSCKTAFVMYGDLLSIETIVKRLKKYDKKVFVHLELVKGLANDSAAIKYLKQTCQPDGIVVTKRGLVKKVKKYGMKAVNHFFAIDSMGLETGIRSVIENQPDIVEIMPALMPSIISYVKKKVNCTVYVAGLVKDKSSAEQAIAAGAQGVITSETKLWGL